MDGMGTERGWRGINVSTFLPFGPLFNDDLSASKSKLQFYNNVEINFVRSCDCPRLSCVCLQLSPFLSTNLTNSQHPYYFSLNSTTIQYPRPNPISPHINSHLPHRHRHHHNNTLPRRRLLALSLLRVRPSPHPRSPSFLLIPPRLFCGNFQTAIGLPTTSDATKITACTATDCGTKGWAIDNADLTLGWQDADFAYKSSDGTTWAVFEGGGVSDAVGAKLVAKFS